MYGQESSNKFDKICSCSRELHFGLIIIIMLNHHKAFVYIFVDSLQYKIMCSNEA